MADEEGLSKTEAVIFRVLREMRLAPPFDCSLPRATDINVLAEAANLDRADVLEALEDLERRRLVVRVPPEVPDAYERWAFLYPSERMTGDLLPDIAPAASDRPSWDLPDL